MTHSSKRRLYLNFSPLFLLFVNTMSFLPVYAKVKKPLNQRYYEPAFKNLMARFEKSVPAHERQKVQKVVKTMSHDLIEFEQAFNAKPFPTSRDSAMSDLIVEYATLKRSVYDMLCADKSLTPELVVKLQDHFKIFRRKVIDLAKTDPSISYVTQPLLSFCSSCIDKLCVPQNVSRFQKVMSTVRRAWDYSKMKLVIGAPLALMLYAVIAPPGKKHKLTLEECDIEFARQKYQTEQEMVAKLIPLTEEYENRIHEAFTKNGLDVKGDPFMERLFGLTHIHKLVARMNDILDSASPSMYRTHRRKLLNPVYFRLKSRLKTFHKFADYMIALSEKEGIDAFKEIFVEPSRVTQLVLSDDAMIASTDTPSIAEILFSTEKYFEQEQFEEHFNHLFTNPEYRENFRKLVVIHAKCFEILRKYRKSVLDRNGEDLELMPMRLMCYFKLIDQLTVDSVKEKVNILLDSPKKISDFAENLNITDQEWEVIKNILAFVRSHPECFTEQDRAHLVEAEIGKCAICFEDYEPESEVHLLSCCSGHGGEVYVNHLCAGCSGNVEKCPFCREPHKKVGKRIKYESFPVYHLGQRLLAERAAAND